MFGTIITILFVVALVVVALRWLAPDLWASLKVWGKDTQRTAADAVAHKVDRALDAERTDLASKQALLGQAGEQVIDIDAKKLTQERRVKGADAKLKEAREKLNDAKAQKQGEVQDAKAKRDQGKLDAILKYLQHFAADVSTAEAEYNREKSALDQMTSTAQKAHEKKEAAEQGLKERRDRLAQNEVTAGMVKVTEAGNQLGRELDGLSASMSDGDKASEAIQQALDHANAAESNRTDSAEEELKKYRQSKAHNDVLAANGINMDDFKLDAAPVAQDSAKQSS
jgi:chromosome segregation ATPase